MATVSRREAAWQVPLTKSFIIASSLKIMMDRAIKKLQHSNASNGRRFLASPRWSVYLSGKQKFFSRGVLLGALGLAGMPSFIGKFA